METRALDEEGCKWPEIDDNQVRAIIETDPSNITQKVAEELMLIIQ